MRNRSRHVDEAGHESVVGGLVHEDAGPGNARLTTAAEDAVGGARHRMLHVRIVEHDVGRFAAELEHHGNQAFSRDPGDQPPRGGAAGEGDHVDARVPNQRLAQRTAEAGQHVEDPGRKTGAGGEVGVAKRHLRRDFRRLQNERVAGRENRRELLGLERERRVPWRDGGDHAPRLMGREAQEVSARRGDRVLERLADGRIVAHDRRGGGRLRPAFGEGLPVVLHLRVRQCVTILVDDVGESGEQPGTFVRLEVPPRTDARPRGGPLERPSRRPARPASAMTAATEPSAGLIDSNVEPDPWVHSPLTKNGRTPPASEAIGSDHSASSWWPPGRSRRGWDR